jgi:hypothetical protein
MKNLRLSWSAWIASRKNSAAAKNALTTSIELAGLICFCVAGFVVDVAAGFVVTGACLQWLGYSLK